MPVWLLSCASDWAPLLYGEGLDRLFSRVVVILVVALLGMFITYNLKHRDAREGELRELADRLRLKYSQDPDFDRPQCPAFHQGTHRHTIHTLHGDYHGRLLQAGDYRFSTPVPGYHIQGPGLVRDHPFTYVQLQQPGAIFEAVALQPRPAAKEVGPELGTEGAAAVVAHNLTEVLGGATLPLADPALAERYILHTEDAAYAQALLTPRVVELLLREHPRMLYFGAWGLTIVAGERLWTAAELAEVVCLAGEILDALPPEAFRRPVD